MATYTLELFRVMEFRNGDIGLNDYPLFDESHRETLNNLITMTYLTREIGQESPDLFAYRMRAKMHQIMPYYNQLYESETLAFNAITNMKVKTTSNRESTGSESSDTTVSTEGTNKSTSRAVNSVLPQVELSGVGQYATDMTDSNGGTQSTSSNDQLSQAENNVQEDVTSESEGYQGDPNALLASHRDNMLNIDMTIVTELRGLFMTVWELPGTMLPLPFTPYPNI